MKLHLSLLILLPLAAAGPVRAADDFAPEPGFELLFNGQDLSGFTYRKKRVVTERFDGKTETSDGRYSVADGVLVVHPKPEVDAERGRLWTAREFPEDFVLKLEFKASRRADSGVFLRKPQLQVRDYPEVGPYPDLKAYKANDWNEIVITVTGESAHVTCNGEVLEEAMKVPPTGPIGFESDRGTVEYRRIRLKPTS